jgi:sugar porter (SP) family MFS transporter
MIIAGRVVLGMGVGLEGGTVPVYVAETAERKVRGNLVSLYQLNIALGEVLGYAVAAMFLRVPGNWRYMLGSSLVFSTIMLVGMLFLPESPRFLVHKGRVLDAYCVWKRIRGIADRESRREFFIMNASVQDEARVVAESAVNKRFPWLDFFTVPRARRALIYANVMILLGQLTGVNAIMYYMSVLMNQIGFDREQANYMSLVGGGSLLLGTIPAVLFMERYGRRFWANTMLPGFVVGLVIIGASYQIPLDTNLKAAEACYLIGLILYMGFFGCYACLTWVVPSEVYPTYLRSYGMTTSTALLFLASFVVTYNFSAMQEAMTRTGLTLGFYGGIAVVGWVYQLLFMPETKDKTLEEIDLLFQRSTSETVAENVRNLSRGLSDFFAGRWSSKSRGAGATPVDVLPEKGGNVGVEAA